MQPRVPLRVPPRPTRERISTSCNECRRRKQKCSQGQPCTNCARRFPQPVCEYKPSRRRNPPGVSSHPTFTVTLRPPANDEPATKKSQSEVPEPAWSKDRQADRTGLEHGGQVASWSGVDMTTRYPSTVSLGRLVNFHDQPRTPPSQLEDVTLCPEGCTKHSRAVHDAVRLILCRVSVPDRFLAPWRSTSPAYVQQLLDYHTAASTRPAPWQGDEYPFTCRRIIHLYATHPRPSRAFRHLTFPVLKLLSRYKTCLDGNPDPANPIVKFYVPFCIQDPLMLHIILYTSTCFLNETGHIPKLGVMAHKGKAIRMLNENLRSQSHQTNDAVIAGVVQLVVNEWYWGDTDDLCAHMRGLREMIRIRGGFHNLGMDGLLAKMVIAHDAAISIAHEIQPFLGNGIDFEYDDPTAAPFLISHNTPFVNELPSFAASAGSLGLHPTTASILDDVRFLINSIMSLPENPSLVDLQKIAMISAGMYERISKLPGDSPVSTEVEDSNTIFPANSIDANTGAAVSVYESDVGTTTDSSAASGSGNSPATYSEGGSRDSASPQAQQRAVTIASTSCRFSRGHREAAVRPDFMYRVIRMAALVTVRAVRNRQPLSEAGTLEEFLEVWTTTWRVPLTTWRGTIGIFNWAMVTIVPLSHGGAHERFARTMYTISMVSRAMEDWGLFIRTSEATMRLQRWLSRGRRNEGAVAGGGKAVARHGFMNPGWD